MYMKYDRNSDRIVNNTVNCVNCGDSSCDLYAVTLALIDANLYLDTHPNDREALEYYMNTKALEEKLREDLVCRGCSITASDQNNVCKWNWVEGPWPWEGVK